MFQFLRRNGRNRQIQNSGFDCIYPTDCLLGSTWLCGFLLAGFSQDQVTSFVQKIFEKQQENIMNRKKNPLNLNFELFEGLFILKLLEWTNLQHRS